MYRLFVAVDLPDEPKERLLRIRYGLPGAKWVDESQMHITLRFIGEVDGAVFRDAQEALAEVEVDPIDITVSGVGFFPPRKDPEILWAGVENNDRLVHLRNKVESALVRAGLKRESRKFFPHIRLARLKETPSSKVARFLSEYALFKLEPFTVTEFCLYSSFLSSERALHEVEASYPLTGKRRDRKR